MYYASPILEAILDRAEDVAVQIAGPNAAAVDEEATWPEASMRALQARRLTGLVVPSEAGGMGQGMFAVAQVGEILGRHCPSTALCFGMHCVGTAAMAARATPEQRRTWLEPIAAGEHLTTLALSEPGTGSHFYLPQTELCHEEGRYRLRGTKSFVTNGGRADSYVVSAAAVARPGEAGVSPGEFSCVVVPAGAEGLDWQPPWSGMGMRGNSARSVELRDVEVPVRNLLGAEGDQIWYVFQVIAPFFLMAMSGTYLGAAQAALDEAVTHLGGRSYADGSRSPAESSVVQRDLGRLWRRLEATRRLIFHAGAAADAGEEDALLALMSAKAAVAECAVEVVNGALTLVGGRGYSENSRLGRLLRDIRAADVMSPTTQILEVWTGRALLGLPLLMD